jgi:hypothetical protein
MADIDNSADALRAVLGSKIVSYQAIFAKAFGSVPAAVFLSQGFFWQENAQHKDLKTIEGKSFFDKTIAEWYDATGITEEQQKTARELLRGMNILLECRVGVPARLHYHIDFSALVAVIYRYKETGRPVAVDNRSKKREITRASSGKFRRLEAVNSGDIIESIENLESIDIKKEKKRAQTGEANRLIDEFFDLKTEEPKSPPVAPAPPQVADPIEYATDIAVRYVQANLANYKNWHDIRFVKMPETPQAMRTDIEDFFVYWQRKQPETGGAYQQPEKWFIQNYRTWIGTGKRLKAQHPANAPRSTAQPTSSKQVRRPGGINDF